jgi:hypothetical protein
MTPGDIYCKRGSDCFCGEPTVKCPSSAIATEPESVRHPAHYARFVIEPVTFAVANGLPFDVANVVKYVCRADAKNKREDIRKAMRYCQMIIERFDREDRIKAGENAQNVWSEML